jgi:hypothetical protein
MATKKFFFSLETFSIKDGSEIRFWEDRWLGMPYFYVWKISIYNLDMMNFVGIFMRMINSL